MMNGSLNMNRLSDDLTGPFRAALTSLEAAKGEDEATENINTFRRRNGLPERRLGRIHARWNDDLLDRSGQIYRHARREPEESIGLPVVVGILVFGFVLGQCVAWLAGWRPW